METFIAKKNVILKIDLIVGGNFVQPDEGSIVRYSLLGNDFSPMEDYTDVEVESDSYGTSISVVIPKEANEISEIYEVRTVILDFLFDGRRIYLKKQYRLSEVPAHLVTSDQVRGVFGLNDSDIPDELIDVDSAYFKLLLEYPKIESWFKSGGFKAIKANRILALTTALSFATGLPLFTVASETDGTSKMVRFEKGMDFARQISEAKTELGELLDELTGESSTNSAISYFNVVTTDNIFTGQ